VVEAAFVAVVVAVVVAAAAAAVEQLHKWEHISWHMFQLMLGAGRRLLNKWGRLEILDCR